MEETTVVNTQEPTTPVVSEDVNTQVEETPTPAGGKTDPNLLLKSLKEEREKRRLLEEQIATLQTNTQSDTEDVFSDEGKALKKRIDALESALADNRTENAKKDLQMSNPVFKEKWEEFEEFRSNPENKGMNLRTAAKAYLIENGLLETPRKGLEKPTGGTRTPTPTGMTSEDKLNLMKNNFREYQKLLMQGKI